MLEQVFSIPQLFGYLAFVFGVGCFLQKNDRRFKQYMAIECLSYVIHFFLLGNYTAVASAAVSVGRSVSSIYTQDRRLGAVFIGASLILGAWLYNGPASLLPIAASCGGTFALFWLRGIDMRLMMLVGNSCWIANNILSGSIGGSALEIVIFVINCYTIWRMRSEATRSRLVPAAATAE
jgi:hypothetical protein